MKTKKRSVGRPKLPKGKVRGIFAIRLSDEEREAYRKRAEERGMQLSEWIREMLRQSSGSG